MSLIPSEHHHQKQCDGPPYSMSKSLGTNGKSSRRISLKFLAAHLGLSPSTISYVLNDTPGRSIPEATRNRVRRAAAEFNYQPSMIARTLQGKPMRTVGILLPELGEGYHSQVLSGVGDLLIESGYFYFTVHHRHKPELVAAYPSLLLARGVDGILAIDTHLAAPLPMPAVLIAGETDLTEVTNVVLDHAMAARLAVQHLYELGHRKIVFMKGQSFSTDSQLRWTATMDTAREYGITIDESLIVELAIDSSSPEIGYPAIHNLLERRAEFTAICCFNDISAMGSIRALHDAGLRVPDDVSILGFDDIQSAAYQVPSLSTIRQPLKLMGSTGASALLAKLAGEETPSILRVQPELVFRESTCAPRKAGKKAKA
jgi:DNA-binding LacI/PurR family transcriptional regulator